MGLCRLNFREEAFFGREYKIHAKEIYSEFTVDVMELVFIFPVSLIEMFWLHFFKVMEIVRAFRFTHLCRTKNFRSFFGTRVFPQWGQRSFMAEKRLSC